MFVEYYKPRAFGRGFKLVRTLADHQITEFIPCAILAVYSHAPDTLHALMPSLPWISQDMVMHVAGMSQDSDGGKNFRYRLATVFHQPFADQFQRNIIQINKTFSAWPGFNTDNFWNNL